tara:strand:- start:375 stop:569 length:195 start_codon:yes stop_codon:yes gene_type:complete
MSERITNSKGKRLTNVTGDIKDERIYTEKKKRKKKLKKIAMKNDNRTAGQQPVLFGQYIWSDHN